MSLRHCEGFVLDPKDSEWVWRLARDVGLQMVRKPQDDGVRFWLYDKER